MSTRPFAWFYFCYFGFLGLFNPFWALYLAERGMQAWQIALLTSLLGVARITAPSFWGAWSDRLGKRRAIGWLGALGGAVCFTPLLWRSEFAVLFGCLLLSHFFWAAALPLAEASTLWVTRERPGGYGRVRVWGSIGFVAVALLVGQLIKLWSLDCLPLLAWLSLLSVVWAAWQLPEVVPPRKAGQSLDFIGLCREPRLRWVLLACFLMALAHGPYYTFYSLALKGHGYAADSVGWLWSVGVLCEIAVFWWMPRLAQRFRLEQLMLASLLAAALRFALMGFGLGIGWLALLAQSLHALTFGVHHAAAVGLIHHALPPEHQGKGQGLYLVVSFGLGGTLGGLLGGWLQPWSGLDGLFIGSALAALLAALLYGRSLLRREVSL